MKIFSSRKANSEDQAVSNLIAEQRQKESAEVWRRGWCISEAACAADDLTVERPA